MCSIQIDLYLDLGVYLTQARIPAQFNEKNTICMSNVRSYQLCNVYRFLSLL